MSPEQVRLDSEVGKSRGKGLSSAILLGPPTSVRTLGDLNAVLHT